MSHPVIWLHEDALRASHPVFAAAPAGARVIHVWDDAYLQKADYSFKRLVFLYETLCELPLEILPGATLDILRACDASAIYTPASLNPAIQHIITNLSAEREVVIVADEPFVSIAKPTDATRFFRYWGKAEKTAFLHNGGADAK